MVCRVCQGTKICKVCQNIQGLWIHKEFVKLRNGLSRYEWFVKIWRDCKYFSKIKDTKIVTTVHFGSLHSCEDHPNAWKKAHEYAFAFNKDIRCIRAGEDCLPIFWRAFFLLTLAWLDYYSSDSWCAVEVSQENDPMTFKSSTNCCSDAKKISIVVVRRA